MTREKVGRYWFIGTFVVAIVALVLQSILVVNGQGIIDDDIVRPAMPEPVRRLFSYFTIQSNILVAVSMFMIITGRIHGQVFRVLRLASLIGITVTGVVAAVALPPSPSYTFANLLCDRLLHLAVPVLTVIGWAVFGPRGAATRADLLPTLIWPVLWLVATLLLGPVTHWYPYPFLNVDTIGLGSVLLNSLVIAVLFLALAACALWLDRRLPGQTHELHESASQDDRSRS